ncbi:unnamed protein product [Tilletia controversa]|nr:unnamed protein product [Tilletia controversa]CAD6909436.1 unnamed protein product [Tilletia controversa]CAD6909441.1 unnamed protein product [Tilletia controversa]
MITLAPLLSSSAHPSLLDDIKEAQQSDDAAQTALVSDDPHYAQQDDLIMYDGRVYIPPAGNLRQRVVAAVHDSLPAGHPGPARTIELLRRTHDFPGSRRFVRTDVPAADDFVSTIRQIHQELRLEIQHAQEQQRRFYDRHRAPPPRLQEGQQEGQHVWLLRRNIRTTRPMDKLDHKRLGPFVIEQRVSENAYRLRLPPTLSRLHPVFNVQLLEPYIASPESMRARPTPQQLRVQLNDADMHDLPWRPVQQIMDVRKIGNRFDYLLRWHGLDSSEDSWRAYTDLSNSLEDLLRLFHRRNPAKPCPSSLSGAPATRPAVPQAPAPPPTTVPSSTTNLTTTHPTTTPLATPSPSATLSRHAVPRASPSAFLPPTGSSASAFPPSPLRAPPASSSPSLPSFPAASPFLVSAPALSSVPIPPPLPVPASDPSSLAAPPSSVPPPPASPVPPPTAPTAHYRLRRVPRLNYRE